MKFVPSYLCGKLFSGSPPTRGAWIEISCWGCMRASAGVAPHTGGVD